jgi:hypothetical protein
MSEDRKPTLQVCVTPLLHAAVKHAADQEMTTISEFTRRVLIDRLRATGVDPTGSPRREASAGALA